ncbi:glycosyltransferase [Polluticoccus soli]|uniref:glycosyltransferase n=1 Tax=Polluticoccus soli TaxID=3034150 RepID=UPI0023E1347C|nr:glycosyltransferase [Flavipsychrobacter sp. JY13-12]
MKIAIVGPAYPLRGGGISTFNERLAEVLQELGHDVIIYSFSLQYPSFLFPGKSQFTDEPAPAHLKIRTIINSINPFNWLTSGNEIKKARPDLLIVRYWLPFMGPCLGTILRIVRGNKHTRILCIADNVIPHEKRPGDLAFTKYFLKPVDSFVTMSKEVLKDLKNLTNKPASYQPHPLYDNYGPGVSREEALTKLKLPEGKYLLFFGFIRKYKGLDLLLEAMADERIKAAGTQLIVAGEFYGDRELYEQIIDKNDLRDQVQLFTEFIPNDEVKYYFSAADLVVQPYRSATQSGISQVAYHFEKPMVVTNVGGLAELIPDGKVGYVTGSEPKAIADAIVKFFQQDPAVFAAYLKEEKKKYTWDHFTKTLLATAFGKQ